MINNNKISNLSAILLVVAGIFIFASIVFPLWRIEMDAPQYPEGLTLYIHSNKIGGDVEIINGLNHYIGMKTLHADEFIEFSVLPYILGFFGIITLIAAFVKRRKFVNWVLGLFVVFGVLAMVDFYRWLYDYGHDLDPNAAIIVPGMAYQPPMLGFKQLLNFGVYSIPDLGGWVMFLGGALIFFVAALEGGFLNKFLKKRNVAILGLFMMMSCAPDGPDPIALNKDACEHCKMTISNGQFAGEIITKKGRVYKFDDMFCVRDYREENPDMELKATYIHYFLGDNELIPAESAFYVKSSEFRSPMGGNIAAFKSEAEALEYQSKMNGELIMWSSLVQ
ncbi:MAG: nitrous oxide reductase accessory protein NosL [Chitinophagales bacterium]|nr:nitrous oxide reductase accessory protein NosL [Chitinophagales bacterium]